MQSTGLKDKNGKEIFEGDVVTYAPLKGLAEYERGEVRYDEPFAAWCLSRPEGFLDPLLEYTGMWTPDCWEVIGNIWENPTLLKP